MAGSEQGVSSPDYGVGWETCLEAPAGDPGETTVAGAKAGRFWLRYCR